MGLFNWLFKRNKQPAHRAQPATQSRTSAKQGSSSRPLAAKAPGNTAVRSSKTAGTQRAAAHLQWIKPGESIKIQGYEIAERHGLRWIWS